MTPEEAKVQAERIIKEHELTNAKKQEIELSGADAPQIANAIKDIFVARIQGSNPLVKTTKIDAQNSDGKITSTNYICTIEIQTNHLKHIRKTLGVVEPKADDTLKKSKPKQRQHRAPEESGIGSWR